MVKRVERVRMPISRTGTYNRPLSGFTLLELLVVIFIVSLFMAISLPTFTDIGTNETIAEAKRLASILRYLNDTAVARKEEMYLMADLKDGSIAYLTEEGEKKERLEHLRSVFLGSKGEINDGQVKVFFTPLGAREVMRFYFRKQGSKGSGPLMVELNPLSGRVKIKEGE